LNFESELKQGRFVVGECAKCNKICWPPSEFCSNCFGTLNARPIKEPGVLLEWSAKDGKIFGIIEFEKSVRVIGIISGNNHKQGEPMKIASCGFDVTPKFTFSSASHNSKTN